MVIQIVKEAIYRGKSQVALDISVATSHAKSHGRHIYDILRK